MARKPSPKAPQTLSLAAIVAAGEAGTFAQMSEIQAFAEAGHVEVNAAITDAHGAVAVRATPAGVAAVNEAQPEPTETKAPEFTIGDVPDDIFASAQEKKRAGRKAGEKYPFGDLEVKKGFFVAATEKMPEPEKSLASTISTAMARYAVEEKDAAGNIVNEEYTVKEYELDEEGKRVKDADGHWIVTSERQDTRPKMVPTRVFRAVKAEGGAWVVRVQ